MHDDLYDSMYARYARLVVRTGVNLQKGQTLVISAPVECIEFVRCVAQAAWDAGCGDVVMDWSDAQLTRMRLLQGSDAALDTFPAWNQDFFTTYLRSGAAFLKIAAADPSVMADVPSERMGRWYRAMAGALGEYQQRLGTNQNAWSVVAIPTVGWAKQVFPHLEEAEAVKALWQSICRCVRLDEADPEGAWAAHIESLTRRCAALNTMHLQKLRYRSDIGTDFTVSLPEGHLWVSGGEHLPDGTPFIPNMPTEEVFTVPARHSAEGVVYGSRPLAVKSGGLVEDFSLTFRDGKVVDFHARQGQEILAELLATDAGSCYLGEVALVSRDCPVTKSGVLFLNTLFDENAACHLALGNGIPFCLREGVSPESADMNASQVHQDFMIGTDDLDVTGYTADGTEIPLLRHGAFAF